MNEELTLAIEILRQKPQDHSWFIPVLLSKCVVPDRDIGAGETLPDIQQVRLYEDWQGGIKRIISVINPKAVSLSASESGELTESGTVSILFMAANPKDLSRLRLDEELREIQTKLIRSKYRDRFHIETRWALRLQDLLQSIITVKPRIVHFAGQGDQSGALVMEDSSGRSHRVKANVLAAVFEAVALECVVLNYCHSSKLARVIAEHVKYVIGMEGLLSDRAAIAFGSYFYQALGFGRSIEEAFNIARTQIELVGSSDEISPVLITKR